MAFGLVSGNLPDYLWILARGKGRPWHTWNERFQFSSFFNKSGFE